MIRKIVLLFLLSVPNLVQAQTSTQLNAAEIKLGLKKLNILGSVLYVAAHPDDENTRFLSYLSKGRNVRTGYLSMTRGDGGQNLIGNEQSELLGLIRTQELLAARRMDGAEQFFTRANDFGFSKNPDETFKIWGKEQILADAVWVIRKFRPDIMIARFPEDSRAGHGHHSASAILAREAFTAAADPKRFPEQLKYVQVWQAKRLLVNGTSGEGLFKLDIGSYNPLLGKGYGEIAAESRSNHKTQGFGSAKSRGLQQPENLSLVAGDLPKTDLFDGIDMSWKRVNSDKIAAMIVAVNQSFNVDDPSLSVPALLNILSEVENLKDDYWRTQKTKELKELIVACSGLWFESYAANPIYASGNSITLRHDFVVQSKVAVILQSIITGKSVVSPNIALSGNIKSLESSVIAEKLTQPYWLSSKHPIGYYIIDNPEIVGNPENPDRLSSVFTFSINNKTISFDRPVVYKYTDPVRGEVYQPLAIAPPITTTIPEKAYIFGSIAPKTISVSLKSFTDNIQGTLQTVVPAGWKISPATVPLSFTSKGEEKQIEFTITPSAGAKSGALSISILAAGKTLDKGLKIISYDHIPTQTLFPLSEAQLINIDLNTDVKNIGYLDGAGDLIPESLRQLGYKVTVLNENNVLNSDLSVYDAIITGVRAYNVNERMRFMQPKLMEYVNNGGTFLVQYNNNARLVVQNIGPYPFSVTGSRVTDEFAKITIVSPQDPALNYPNKITDNDFEGWIQERGLYFVSNIDKNYTPIFSMNDAGEPVNNGSLIVGNYGKGKFVYTSLAFFRQLPAGVPGAYRLFVNLLAKKQ
ncbi:MAG TPA: LmbE family protein [Sphingobacteriaceae bacterium]|nr:LmbE family protein [Sphingobacteriaceae bacterium]